MLLCGSRKTSSFRYKASTAAIWIAASKELFGEVALMATYRSETPVAMRHQYVPPTRQEPIVRLLEDECHLAFCRMLPTILLLVIFIPYPFVNGILLAVTDTRVGWGRWPFRWPRQFRQDLERRHHPHRRVEYCLYTVSGITAR
jgi:hypothetical protein